MADAKVAKLPMQIPNKAHRQKVQKEMVVPKPKPKPKPKRAAGQVETKSESEYTELRPTRNSFHSYEPLCVSNKEKAQSDEKSPAVQEPVVSEVHYANLGIGHEHPQDVDYESYSVVREAGKVDKPVQKFPCNSAHWKVFLSVAIAVLVVLVLVLVLLVLAIATVSLSRTKENSDKYQELQRTSEQMAEQIGTLQEQLNNSATTSGTTSSSLQQLREEISVVGVSVSRLSETTSLSLQQLRDSVGSLSESTTQKDNMFNSKLDDVQNNITSIMDQLQTTSQNLSSHITRLDDRTKQIDISLAAVNGTAVTSLNELLSDTNLLQTQVDSLNTTVSRLEIEVDELSMNTVTLNSTLLQFTVPLNCTSDIYQDATLTNLTYLASPPYSWDSHSVSTLANDAQSKI